MIAIYEAAILIAQGDLLISFVFLYFNLFYLSPDYLTIVTSILLQADLGVV